MLPIPNPPDLPTSRHWTSTLALVLALLCAAAPGRGESLPSPRNVVIFLVDDLGWSDLGCTGSDLHETPRIDAVAAEGLRFTSGYSACTVCSPTRAALLTGQHPARLHLTDFIPGAPFVNTPMRIPDWRRYLRPEEPNLARALGERGYATAHLGKWHLAERKRDPEGGPDWFNPEQYPDAYGFEVNVGGCEMGAPGSYFWPYGRGRDLEQRKDNSIYRTLPDDGTPDEEREGEYLTDRLAGEAEQLIDRFAGEGRPFFLHFSFYNVHTPLMGRPDLVEKYEAKLAEIDPAAPRSPGHDNAVYAAMVESVDEAVGRVLDRLAEHGLEEETLVVFTSDNGGFTEVATSNAPLRQGKGSVYEGGVRVPLILRLPGAPNAGELCHVPAITMDLLPTVLDLLGEEVPEEMAPLLDGVSLRPLLEDPRASLGREDLFWHYPHYHSNGARPYSAMRSGNWKLIEVIGEDRLELYDLGSDLHENFDLVREELPRAREMYGRLVEWRRSVGAQMPSRNPAYDPSRPIGIQRGERFVEPRPLREEIGIR